VLTLEDYFAGWDYSRMIFDRLLAAAEAAGPLSLRVTKSQAAFVRRKAFAWAWIPGRYLKGETAPLVLSLAFDRSEPSPRWKEIVEPRPGRFTHHLELSSPEEVDAEVRAWLREAWNLAG
jgi:hypothetical protein